MTGASSRIRLVVFDLDGTLVDSSRDLATAVNAALARLLPGAPPAALPLDTVRAFIGEGARRLIQRSLEHVGRPDLIDGALPLFMDAYRGCLLDTTRCYPGVEETLDRLAAAGCELAVLTNKPGGMSRTILEGLGLARRFRRVVGGDDLPTRKPDPAGLLELMREAGCGPEQTALVGDSAVDVETGRAAGVRTVGVAYGLDPGGLAHAGPDLLLADIRSLPADLGVVTVLG